MPATLNIGLSLMEAGETGYLSISTVLSTLAAFGCATLRCVVRDSASEPTAIIEISKPLSPAQAFEISARLRQEAIAQRTANGGALYGPAAERWGVFNPAYFIDF